MRIVVAQIAVTVALAAACLVLAGAESGRSALYGGGIGVVTTAYMAFAVLRYRAGTDAARIALGFMVGWVIKVLMTIALLVIAFRSKAVAPVPLLVAYGATLLSFWIVATWGSPRGVPRNVGPRENDGRANGSSGS
jgi:F0F1-type ATP synthase assembly protein I